METSSNNPGSNRDVRILPLRRERVLEWEVIMRNWMENPEGYIDPTAAQAVRKVTREERWDVPMRMVYICSRYGGDVRRNTKDAIRFCRFAMEKGFIPVASHLLYPRILNDQNPRERSLGLKFGMELMKRCQEVWVFSDGTISSGMRKEIYRARSRNMKIRWFDLYCVEREGDRVC